MNSAPPTCSVPPLRLCLRIDPSLPADALNRSTIWQRLAELPAETPISLIGNAQLPVQWGARSHDSAEGDHFAALTSIAAKHPDQGLLWIDLACELPEGWWPRLSSAIEDAPSAPISPLCNDLPGLPKALQAATANSARLADGNRLLSWLAPQELLPSEQVSNHVCYWPAGSLTEQMSAGSWIGTGFLYPRLLVASGIGSPTDEVGMASPALLGLEASFNHFDGAAPTSNLGDKPLLLHVLHGWGGGAERFVRDLIAADETHQHAVLRALNEPDRGLAAVGYELLFHFDQPALRRWRLQLPIRISSHGHAEYQAMLARIRQEFAPAAVLVSSLVGHSLDALRTGLPTTQVCHDYFPAWPILHANFDDARQDFSCQAIAQALDKAAAGEVFGERRAAWWQGLRRGWVDVLTQHRVQLIAPSPGVKRNLQRIEPKLNKLSWHIIPHGLADWAARPGWSADLLRHRVLVPGRIKGGKGQQLLRRILGKLPPGIELVLLGAGDAGMEFFGHPQVHVLLDYQRDELPFRIAALRPRAALMLSTVAETFSYALSEMQSLGVPVIATRMGAFVDRLQDGETAWLVDPTPDSVLAAIERLLRNETPPAPQFDFEANALSRMAAAYQKIISLAESRLGAARPMALDASESTHLQLQLRQRERERVQLQQAIDELRGEAARRADWAREQSALAESRLGWARALEREVESTRNDWRSADEARHAAEQDRQSALNLADELKNTLAEHQRWVESLSQQRDEFERERNDILASSSWKLTAPIRVSKRVLKRLVERAKFSVARAGTFGHRAKRSLKTRGLAGSVRRLGQEIRPPQPKTALDLPETLPGIEGIQFAIHGNGPIRASIVVPVYNQLQHTLTCLRALMACADRDAFEVIVVYDGSSDATADLLPEVPGLVFHKNPQNLGFIGACNAGAGRARGEFVVFLNNDTAVQPGWLEALLDTFVQQPNVGLAGAKLVYPDGRLQEAGGIVFSDGSGWNYGRFDDPADPRYNFVREVDYCSGAAIALPRALFEQLNGFDSHYAPAYYEDTDLAMRVRQAGLRVMYQPKSVVVHFEGVTSGTDTSSGTKRYQVINQTKFLERWNNVLKTHAAPGTDILIARQHRCRKQVLVIDATTPQPDQDSGSVRLTNLFKLLIEDRCAVTFFAENRAWVERYTEQLQQLGVEVLWHPFMTEPVSWFADNGKRFDCIVVSRHYVLSNYYELIRRHAPKAKLVFDTVDLHYLREQRAADLADRDDLRKTAADTRKKELGLINKVDLTWVVSPVEQALLAKEAPAAKVSVLSNVHPVFGCRRPFAERKDLMFVGGFQHPPNVDAVTWFCHEVFPKVREQLPEVQFHVIGSKAPAELKAVGDLPGVTFHGFVADITPFMDECRLAVAPLRYGAGVKGKVNMSMSYGQPVVGTPMAVEGMHLRPGEDVLVGDTPEELAAAVARLYQDEALWNQLSANGLANVERHFGFASARAAVHEALDMQTER